MQTEASFMVRSASLAQLHIRRTVSHFVFCKGTWGIVKWGLLLVANAFLSNKTERQVTSKQCEWLPHETTRNGMKQCVGATSWGIWYKSISCVHGNQGLRQQSSPVFLILRWHVFVSKIVTLFRSGQSKARSRLEAWTSVMLVTPGKMNLGYSIIMHEHTDDIGKCEMLVEEQIEVKAS